MPPFAPRAARALLVGAALVGCAPEIGDACSSSVDCSVNGERICDTASPGGYCSVPSCDEGTCPEESVCVEFRFDPPRLASSWCMARCSAASDCRADEGYACTRASELTDAEDEPIAQVIDPGLARARFCSAKP